MNTPTFIFISSLTAWLLCTVRAGIFAAAGIALGRLQMREIIDSEGADHFRTNLWLRHSGRILASARIWHVLFLVAAAGLVPVMMLHAPAPLARSLSILITLGALLVTVLLGNLLPCFIGTWYSRRLAASCIRPLYAWSAVTMPIDTVLLSIAGALAGMVGIHLKRGEVFVNEDADEAMNEIGDKEDSLEADEHEMIRSIFEFGETVVREVMTPRTAMVALPVTISLDEAIGIALEKGHSRLPAYEEDADHIAGIFYVRDALKYWNARSSTDIPPLGSILRNAFFVPETKKVNELLNEFRSSKIQMAVIVDEYGGTSGIATMEDLLEEIVGEIQDEYDTEQQVEFTRIDDSTYELDAAMSVDDANDLLEIHLPEEEDFDTLGGYIMFKLGRLPTEGEVLHDKECDLRILKVTDRRVDRLELIRHPVTTNEEEKV